MCFGFEWDTDKDVSQRPQSTERSQYKLVMSL